ncbi:uncharacterized protein LOC131055466 isoform X1 [Cryptomeria japonica]|uniref:uncharacterized protein LOC131055466 isoform X1 n=1 Tax=Cryptomeria japonica TaxID=3369 RepID=UPI0025AD10BD|nr:uncharacterized protein LOC131055466 isoform X1 [Cryptomeria japonica]
MKNFENSGQTRKPAFVQNSVQNASQVGGPNWVIIFGGAIVSILSVKLGRKLREAIGTNWKRDDVKTLNEPDRKSDTQGTLGVNPLHSRLCCYRLDGVVRNHYVSGGSHGMVEMKVGPQDAVCQCENKSSHTLALLQQKLSEFSVPCNSRENIPLWECLEQHDISNGHLQQSNSSESVSTSDTSPDLLTKRDVARRLRQQVKRRDDMIVEMQTQITYQQQTITSHFVHMENLQMQLDAANKDLFGAEREIQRLRKAIADHCAGNAVDMSCSPGPMTNNHVLLNHSINRSMEDAYGSTVGDADHCNGETHRFQEQEQGQRYDLRTSDVKICKIGEGLQCFPSDRKEAMATDEYTIESVKDLEREVAELKQLVSGKNHLLEAYERQRIELCSQLKELHLNLGTQVGSVL